MKERRTTRSASDAWKRRRMRLRLECRECEVICERVVSPWYCLKSSCPYVYVFYDGETRYFGCLHKVFGPELDLSVFETPATGKRAADPYGSLRVARSPRPECRVSIEHAYHPPTGQGGCCNPTFFHHPAAPKGEGMRLTVNHLDDPDLDRREQ